MKKIENISELKLRHIFAKKNDPNAGPIPFDFEKIGSKDRKIYCSVEEAIKDIKIQNLVPYEVFYHQTPGELPGQNRGTILLSWEEFEEMGMPLKIKETYSVENID